MCSYCKDLTHQICSKLNNTKISISHISATWTCRVISKNYLLPINGKKRGSGVGACNKEKFRFTVREDLNQLDAIIEQLTRG